VCGGLIIWYVYICEERTGESARTCASERTRERGRGEGGEREERGREREREERRGGEREREGQGGWKKERGEEKERGGKESARARERLVMLGEVMLGARAARVLSVAVRRGESW